MSEVETRTYPAEHLRRFTADVFRHFGVPDDEAQLAAEVLARSDLRGIDSHGVARLRAYVDMLTRGEINPTPKIKVVRQTESTARIDGDGGLGLVVGPKGNEIALQKAAAVGSGWVTVFNSNHYGIAGYYVLEAIRRDMIGWSMTNSTALVAPLWGAERMLGTNPLAVAFPGKQEPPVVIDMATAAVAYGKVEIAQRKKQQVPEGWLVDADGNRTTDPWAMVRGGALLPLGSDRDHGGHKGYALSMMVDILSCVLSGANWGPFAPPFALQQKAREGSVGKGIGHFFGALRIDGFMDPEEFKASVDEFVRLFRATKPEPGTSGPLIPGDPEREAEAERSQHGIPLVMPVVEDLREVSRQTGVAFD